MPILVLWVLCGFLGDCLWTSGGLPVASQYLKEKGALEEEGGAVEGVFCLILSGLASGPWNTLYEHFWLQQPHSRD